MLKDLTIGISHKPNKPLREELFWATIPSPVSIAWVGFTDGFSGTSVALDTGLGAGFCLETDDIVLATGVVGGPSFMTLTCEAGRKRYAISKKQTKNPYSNQQITSTVNKLRTNRKLFTTINQTEWQITHNWRIRFPSNIRLSWQRGRSSN